MEKKSLKIDNPFVSEEEKTLNWESIQNSFKKTFGSEVYTSWLKNITLLNWKMVLLEPLILSKQKTNENF